MYQILKCIFKKVDCLHNSMHLQFVYGCTVIFFNIGVYLQNNIY